MSRKALFPWYEKKGCLRTKSLAVLVPPARINQKDREILDVDFKAAPQIFALPAFLDPQHEFSAIELRAANDAWLQTSQRNLEAFLGLAMKAQAQSRATIATLVDLKFP